MLLVIIFSVSVTAQENCEVLKPGLKGSYRGECLNNLAHGYGEATGEDYYIGDFKKGLPHGNGSCKWATGEEYIGDWKNGYRHGFGKYIFKLDGEDAVLEGKWRKDEFVGEELETPYKVEYRNNVGRVTFNKINDKGNYIRLKFIRGSSEFTEIGDVLLQGDSGSENSSRTFTGFEGVEFPFKGRAIFSAPNAFYSATLRCEVRYRIYEKGAWEVKIHF